MDLEGNIILRKAIWIDPDRMGGKPCLMGTRFPVSSILVELAEGRSIKEIAEEFDLKDQLDVIMCLLTGLAVMLDKPDDVARKLHKKKF